MTTQAKAAICRGPHAPFAIEDVELDDLRADELRIRIVACGICHTDLAVRDGQLPVPLPIVLGHEGAGIVEAVGDAVTVARPGDRVVMSFNSCGDCPSCAVDAPTYCYNFFPNNWTGTRADGTPTMFVGGAPMNANFFGQSSFATHAIAHQRNVVRVPDSAAHLPLEQLAPIGCGLMTGAGAVLRSMKVRGGLPIVVFGTGTVGMAAIMAAKVAGADPIVAVDVNDERLALARELGATHAFNARDDAIAEDTRLVPGGGRLCVRYDRDQGGDRGCVRAARARGVLGIVGASDPADMLVFNESQFMGGGRTVKGILGGDSDVGPFVTELIELHLAGRFPFERLIGYFDFAEIDQAIAASESGRIVKPVLRMAAEV